ncbi:MAG: ABC transporter permease [Akkermansiaceae bacterium]
MSKLVKTVVLALRSLALHKLRSGLTILGIIFGVASVITMLAVGKGASEAAQKTIREMGSHNIIIDSIKKTEEGGAGNVPSYGVTHRDIERITETIPEVQAVIKQRIYQDKVSNQEYEAEAQVLAVEGDIFRVKNISISKGRKLCDLDLSEKKSVCVIDSALARKLFQYQDPLTQRIKFKGAHFKVVGIINNGFAENTQKSNFKVYIPLSSAIMHFGELITTVSNGSYSMEKVDVNQLIIKLPDIERVFSASSKLERLMNDAHKIPDYSIKVPIKLLREAEATKRMFSIVLGSIAGISLLVGGIGIMNIMLATVSERTKEIGLRRAIGAKKKDIVSQFMTEAIVLSLIGGIAGVVVGLLIPLIITGLFGIDTIISPVSVVLAFIISGVTGIIFGSYPAVKSASLNPIVALRDS